MRFGIHFERSYRTYSFAVLYGNFDFFAHFLCKTDKFFGLFRIFEKTQTGCFIHFHCMLVRISAINYSLRLFSLDKRWLNIINIY